VGPSSAATHREFRMGCGSSKVTAASVSGGRRPEQCMNVCLVGCDNAGKSTLLSMMRKEIDPATVPTVGVEDPVIVSGDVHRFAVHDVGGGAAFRSLWGGVYRQVRFSPVKLWRHSRVGNAGAWANLRSR
jgi:hypothetical protein